MIDSLIHKLFQKNVQRLFFIVPKKNRLTQRTPRFNWPFSLKSEVIFCVACKRRKKKCFKLWKRNERNCFCFALQSACMYVRIARSLMYENKLQFMRRRSDSLEFFASRFIFRFVGRRYHWIISNWYQLLLTAVDVSCQTFVIKLIVMCRHCLQEACDTSNRFWH